MTKRRSSFVEWEESLKNHGKARPPQPHDLDDKALKAERRHEVKGHTKESVRIK